MKISLQRIPAWLLNIVTHINNASEHLQTNEEPLAGKMRFEGQANNRLLFGNGGA